jgi:hypothetical protein
MNSHAHSAEEVQKAFDRGPIPKELLEATKNLEATAGQKSMREDAHERQHELLEQYIRAGKERKCTEAMSDISKSMQPLSSFAIRELATKKVHSDRSGTTRRTS